MFRDKLAVVVGSVSGVFVAAQYFLTATWAENAYRAILVWMQVIFAFALLVGIATVIRSHLLRAARERAQRPYSIVLLAAIAGMALAGFGGGIERGSIFLWLFDRLQAPMQSTVFSLLAFYVTSAAYRGFRARSAESTILIAAALLVIIGRVPIGDWISPYIPPGAEWVVNVPALAAKRAILIGVGLGMAATSIKVIAGIERTYLGGR